MLGSGLGAYVGGRYIGGGRGGSEVVPAGIPLVDEAAALAAAAPQAGGNDEPVPNRQTSVYDALAGMRTRRFSADALKGQDHRNVFLVKGIRLSGQLAAFDQFVVLLESGIRAGYSRQAESLVSSRPLRTP